MKEWPVKFRTHNGLICYLIVRIRSGVFVYLVNTLSTHILGERKREGDGKSKRERF